MAKKFTSKEMRDMAANIIMSEDDWIEDAAYMLQQAADLMDKIERKKKTKRKVRVFHKAKATQWNSAN